MVKKKSYKLLLLPLKMLLMSNKIYFIIFLIIGLCDSVLNVFMLYFNQYLFDNISLITGDNKILFKVYILIGFFGIITSLELIMNGLFNFMFTKLSTIVNGLLESEIQKKISVIEPICFERSEDLNTIEKAKQGAEGAFAIWITIISLFTFYIPYFGLTGIYLYRLQPILTFLLLIIFIPVFVNQIVRYYVFSKFIDNSTPFKREYDYYARCITDRQYFKETRYLCAIDYFKSKFRESLLNYSILSWKSEKKTFCTSLLMKVMTILGYSVVLYLLVNLLMKGSISIGAFAAIYASIWKMYNFMNELIARHIGDILLNMSSVKNFILFMNLPEYNTNQNMSGDEYIVELKNVYFKYPNNEDYSLKKIEMRIKKNEILAIVGINGSGKSTLARLISTIYQPTSGEVRTVPKQKVSIICQNFQRYKMNLKDNIICSCFSRPYCFDRLKKIGEEAGIEKTFLEKHMETLLAKEFGGTDLSGGQWQRIAIARGLYKENSLIILDEPTSSINPLEESRIFNQFREISKNKTAIYITHRLGSVKIADRIIVLRKGEIVEEGNFSGLIEKNGYFADLYKTQAQWYDKATIN